MFVMESMWLSLDASYVWGGASACPPAHSLSPQPPLAPWILQAETCECAWRSSSPPPPVHGLHPLSSPVPSGAPVFCRQKPVSVRCGIGAVEHDDEGRVVTVVSGACWWVFGMLG
jgi:hypothetical protein